MSWRCKAIVAVDTTTVACCMTRMAHRGDEVGQRLAGPGSGLDGQVLAGLDGALNCLGHRHLPGPLRPADAGDRRGEQGSDIRQTGLAGRLADAITVRRQDGVVRWDGVARRDAVARRVAGIVCGGLAGAAGGHGRKRYRVRDGGGDAAGRAGQRIRRPTAGRARASRAGPRR
jgi:hypothetical protein